MKNRLCIIILLACLFFLPVCFGDDASSNSSSSEAEHKATVEVEQKLKSRTRFPWYDAKAKQLRFIPPYVPKNASRGWDNNTSCKEKDGKDWGTTFFGKLLIWLAVMVLTVVAVIVVWAIIALLRSRRWRRMKRKADRLNTARRLETLLPEVQERMDTLYTDAEAAFLAGRYREAIIFYFSFMLVELDKAGMIVMEKGKTNHDYAREVRSAAVILRFYIKTMNLFERTYYGSQAIDRDMFLSVWEDREPFMTGLRELKTADVKKSPSPARSVTNMSILFALLLMLFLSSSGCNRYWQDYYTNYIPVYEYDRSINGDTLFRSICRDAGHTCYMPFRSPQSLEKYDCIVWYYYNNNSQPLRTLDAQTIPPLNKWLKEKPGRSLIIVNDAYYSDVEFWQQLTPLAPDEHRSWCGMKRHEAIEKEFEFCATPSEYSKLTLKRLKEILQAREKSQQPSSGKPITTTPKTHENKNPENNGSESIDSLERFLKKLEDKISSLIESSETSKDLGNWFHFENLLQVETATHLTGEEYWTKDLPEGPPFRVTRKLTPLEGTKATLCADGYPLICERSVEQGNVYIIQSGSFILNYPLTKERNQLLAARLIHRLGPKKNILFVRSRMLILPENEDDSDEEKYNVSPFALSRLSAFSLLFWHFITLAVVVFFWKYPIFGRPKTIPREKTEDFSRHLSAYGELLELTGNTDWAIDEIEKWSNEKGSN